MYKFSGQSFLNPESTAISAPAPTRPVQTMLSDERLLTLFENAVSVESEDVDATWQMAFYETLLGYDLLLPVPVTNGSTALALQRLAVLTLENGAGERGLPVFTSVTAFSHWNDTSLAYRILPFATLCTYAMDAGVDALVVNVSGPFGCEINASHFRYLAQGLLPPEADTENAEPA